MACVPAKKPVAQLLVPAGFEIDCLWLRPLIHKGNVW